MVDKEYLRLGSQGRQSLADFGVNGRSGLGLGWLPLEAVEPILGADSRVGLSSSPQIDNGVSRSG